MISDEKQRAAISQWILQHHENLERVSYYQLLSVARDATAPQIRDAYYKLVARLHPDLYGTLLAPHTREQLVSIYSRIVEGYRVLSDGARREQYDRGLAAGRLRWSKEDERAPKRDPELEITNPNARRLYRLAKSSLMSGDARSAVFNLKLALSAEPTSTAVREELARAEAAVAAKGK
jgi:curved DNA-binding protein CbpA